MGPRMTLRALAVRSAALCPRCHMAILRLRGASPPLSPCLHCGRWRRTLPRPKGQSG